MDTDPSVVKHVSWIYRLHATFVVPLGARATLAPVILSNDPDPSAETVDAINLPPTHSVLFDFQPLCALSSWSFTLVVTSVCIKLSKIQFSHFCSYDLARKSSGCYH